MRLLQVLIIMIIAATCINARTLIYNDQNDNYSNKYQNLRIKRQTRNRYNAGFRRGNSNNFNDFDDIIWFEDSEEQLSPTIQRTTMKAQTRPQINTIPSSQQCEKRCIANSTAEYNPVCGSNKTTYYNRSRLECANLCIGNIQMVRYGRCEPILPF